MAAYKTRNEWLRQAVRLFRPAFRRIGYPLPRHLVVESKECTYSSHQAECGFINNITQEIRVSPRHNDGYEVLTLLAHELSHAAVNEFLGLQSGHSTLFYNCANAIGLGPDAAFPVTSRLERRCLNFARKLGRYPKS